MNSRIINDNIILVVDVDGTGAGTDPDLEYILMNEDFQSQLKKP